MRDNAHIILPSLPVKPTPRPPPRSIRPSPLGKPLSRCKPPSHCISARNIPPVNVKFPRLQREIFSSQTASSLNPSTEIPLLDRLLEGRLELSPSSDFCPDFFPHPVTSYPSGDFSPHPAISSPDASPARRRPVRQGRRRESSTALCLYTLEHTQRRPRATSGGARKRERLNDPDRRGREGGRPHTSWEGGARWPAGRGSAPRPAGALGSSTTRPAPGAGGPGRESESMRWRNGAAVICALLRGTGLRGAGLSLTDERGGGRRGVGERGGGSGRE